MTRWGRSLVGIAALLAVLMPLEQAHCPWTGLGAPAPAVCPCRAGHDCCSPRGPSHSGTSTPAPCACFHLPAGSLPPAEPAAHRVPTVEITGLAPEPAPEPLVLADAPAPALDVGSPPHPVDPGAHGLRAPPLSA